MNQIINFFLEWLNNVGQWFWDYSAGMFVQSSVLIVLLLIVDFMLRKRVRAVFRYCVWMLVFVKLILPPALSLPTGIGYWYGDYLSADSPVLQQVSSVVRPEPVMVPTPENFAPSTEVSQIQPSRTNPETVASVTSAVSGLNALTWQAVVFGLWLVGVFVISVLLVQRMLFVKGLIAQSAPAKNRLPDMLNRCRRQVGIARNIELRLSNSISSPAVCGLFKPVILIPTALLEKLSPDKLRAVLIHELVHIKRADIWVNLVQTVLQVIYFYNPLVWIANAVVRRIREQAVDEMVLVALGAGAKSYSNTLIDIAEMAFWKTSLSLRLIGVVESKKALHRRIRHMLNRPIPKNAKLGVVGFIVLLVLGFVLLPMAGGNRADADDVAKMPEPMAYWRFDGNANDAMGRHNGIVHGATLTQGISGQAYYFDGDDYIRIEDFYLKEFSLSAWVKTETEYVNNRRIFLLDGIENFYSLQGNSRSAIGLYITDDIEINEYDWSFELKKWTHITVTYDGHNVNIYKNGRLTETAGATFAQSMKGDVYIGGIESHRRGGFWHGMIDEVTIFNRVLNETEVKQLYANQHYKIYGRPRKVSVQRPRPELTIGLGRFAGVWSGLAVDKPGEGTSRDTLTLRLKINENGQLVGEAFGSFVRSEFPELKNLKVVGNRISFELRVRFGGMRVGVTLELKDGKLKGEGLPIDLDEGRCDILLERKSAPNSEPPTPPQPKRGLVLYYSFDRMDGSKVVDLSGNGNHGQVHGARHESNGKIGGAMSFDGEDDYVRIIPQVSLKEFTVSAWVKTETEYLNNRRIFLLDQGRRYFAFEGNSRGGTAFGIAGGPYDGSVGVAEYDWRLGPGIWTHVAMSFDGTTVQLYRNGELTETGRVNEGRLTGTAYIGGIGDHRGGFWHGLIDEVTIFDRALSENEVEQLCSMTATPELYGMTATTGEGPAKIDLAGPAGYWNFDGNANDTVGNKYGIVHGATLTQGISGQAYYFDGDDCITIEGISLRVFSLSVWLKTETEALNNRRVFLLDQGRKYYALQGNIRGGIGFGVAGGTHDGDIEVNEYDWKFEPGKWTHVVVTFDGSTAQIYINGRLRETGAITEEYLTGTAYIGGNTSHRGDFWHGAIDEVVIFNQVLSSEEVDYLFNAFRPSVRLVVGPDSMTFEGQQITWEQLPALLERIPNRGNTVFEIAVSTKEMPLSRYDAAMSRASKLVKQFGFEYISYVGQHPLGSKAG